MGEDTRGDGRGPWVVLEARRRVETSRVKVRVGMQGGRGERFGKRTEDSALVIKTFCKNEWVAG